MAALLPDADRNELADHQAAKVTHLSLHETTPGLTGAAEAAGGSPAYARQPVTFNAAGAVGPLGATLQPATVGVAWSSQVTFDVDPATYGFFGTFDGVSAGTFHGGNSVAAAQVVSSQGQVKLSIGVGPFAGS